MRTLRHLATDGILKVNFHLRKGYSPKMPVVGVHILFFSILAIVKVGVLRKIEEGAPFALRNRRLRLQAVKKIEKVIMTVH